MNIYSLSLSLSVSIYGCIYVYVLICISILTHTLYRERFISAYTIYLEILVQVNVPDTQRGQMNQNVRVWRTEWFIAGSWKETDGLGAKNKQTNKKKQIAKGFEQNILIKAAEEGEGRRVYDQLMHSSLIGWWWGKRAVPRDLVLSLPGSKRTGAMCSWSLNS